MDLKKFPVVTLALLLVIAWTVGGTSSPASAEPDSVLLRMKGKQGEVYQLTQKEKTSMSFGMEGIPVPGLKLSMEALVMQSVSDLTITIQDVTSDGNLDLLMEMGEPAISFAGGIFPFSKADMMEMIMAMMSQQLGEREASKFRAEMEKAMQQQNEFSVLVNQSGHGD